MEKVIFGIPKGRVQQSCLKLLKDIGLIEQEHIDQIKNTRALKISVNEHLELVVLRNSDLPFFLGSGAISMSMVGSDLLQEHDLGFYELADLQYGQCTMVLAVPNQPSATQFPKRIATKYPTIAAKWLEQKSENSHLIQLHGSHEIAPALGLVDGIIDLVETGTTLKENNLVIQEKIFRTSVRLVANPIHYKFHQDTMIDIKERLLALR